MRARRFLITALLLPMALALPVHAYLNEAHSMIMEACQEYVEKENYTLRHDFWNGEIESGKQKLIRHQLFRGNEYWFFAGTSYDGCTVSVEVYDETGQSITVERVTDDYTAAARVNPEKTGSYYVLLKVVSPTEDKVDWALVYAYR